MTQVPLPYVSVVIPSYNAAAFISEALSSIAAQSYRSSLLEIIVVDDNSDDGTMDVIKAKHPEVTLITRVRGGTGAARNTGVATSKGSLICFMDADDLCHPLRIERQVEEFRHTPNLGVCFTNFIPFHHSGTDTISTLLQRADLQQISARLPGTIMVSRPYWDRIGPFDESLRLGEFLDWLIRVKKLRIPVAHIDEALYYRRIHSTNFSKDRSNYSDYARVLAQRHRDHPRS
jgi:glycosyltransferase involved in cell wall biosynthesis